MPSTVDRSAFAVGRDLALTAGAVVDRDARGEVIQYQPATQTVRRRPVLVVPPPIGRFYFLDLRPGRSFVEYAVSRGLQVFMLSWRNPGPEQAGWDLDDYAQRVLSAIEVAREVTGRPDVDIIGFCAGGIITTTVLNHLAATGDDRVASASYAVTLHDFSLPAPIGAFSSPRLLTLARWNSRRAGVISARNMGAVFTWMRPNELVWNYWVNNYLMGNPPPAFDVLAWNADGTNLPAALHRQFLEIFEKNVLCQPGRMTVLGTPVDLSRITVPAYVTGGVTDHLTPWQGCYRTTQLLSGPTTFVLSNAGHIQSLVNPPGNPKATYFAGGEPGPDPQQWLTGSKKVSGTWWEHWADWLLERSGDQVPAPGKLGGGGHLPSEQAPGLYVRDLEPA
jgi:polyhydroxyalkanoate synthase